MNHLDYFKRYFPKILLLICLSFVTESFAQFIPINGPTKTGELSVLWARGDSAYFVSDARFYFTEDGGSTKQDLTLYLPQGVIPRVLTVSQSNLFMGSGDGSRAYLSTDGGVSWNNTDGSSVLWIPTHITSSGANVLIGGTLFEPHYWDESNNRWVSSGLSGTTHALRYIDSETVIANIGSPSRGTSHISTDGGKTWTQLTSEPTIPVVGNAKVYDFVKVGNRILAVANFNGYNTFYTDNNGTTWQDAQDYKVYSLVAYGRKFNVTKDGKVWFRDRVSMDTGRTWQMSDMYLSDGAQVWKDEEFLTGSGSYSLTGNLSAFEFSGFSNSLLVAEGKVQTIFGKYIHQYDGSNWSKDSINDLDNNISFLDNIRRSVYVDGKYYLLSDNGIFSSTDGASFKKTFVSDFEFSKVSAFEKVGNTFVLCLEGSRVGRPPEVYYSTDLSSWTASTFSNSIGFGAGGTTNYVEHIYDWNGKVLLDMTGGLAISSDNGSTFKWLGGSNGGNVVFAGSTLVRLSDNTFGTRQLEYSTDNGESWVKAMEGMPEYTGQSNFSSFGNVFMADGKVYADALVENRRLMQYDASTNKWEEADKNTEIPTENELTSLVMLNRELYGGFQGDGVYKTRESASVNSLQAHTSVLVYPNPASGIVAVDISSLDAEISMYQLNGQQVDIAFQHGRADVSLLPPGLYIIQVKEHSKVSIGRLIVR